MSNSLKVKLGYRNSEQTRAYTLTNLTDDAIDPTNVHAAVRTFNNAVRAESVQGGDPASIFIDNDGNYCNGVVEVIGESTEEVTLLGGA